MATAVRAQAPSRGGLRKSVLIVVGLLAIYFIYEQVLQYFVWNEESYGYYWQFRVPVLVHVAGGLIALLTGIFQLWSGLNRTAMGTHPISGRIYVASVLLGSFGGIVLAFQSAAYGFAWSVSLFCLAVAWLAITATAIYCIKKRNIVAHQQWMVRSYLLTFAFVTFRIVTDHLPYEALWGISRADMANAAIWPVWVIPLVAYEISLAYRDSRSRLSR
jgi:uncharacterized membrane protein